MTRAKRCVYLTFDIDWVADVATDYCLQILQSEGVKSACFFVTHPTPANERIRRAGYTLGVHPNFLPLFSGEGSGTAETILDDLRRVVPDAKAVRSHGLVRGSRLSQLFAERGFSHEANLLVPWESGLALSPYEFPTGLTQVAHDWGDSACLASGGSMAWERYLERPGTKVLTFHPVHLYLNSRDLRHYEGAKVHTRNAARLTAVRNTTQPGMASTLKAFIAEVRRQGLVFDDLLSLKAATAGGGA